MRNVVKIVVPVVFALILLTTAGFYYHRHLRKNETKDNQESDNKEINYKSTRCPEKIPPGVLV